MRSPGASRSLSLGRRFARMNINTSIRNHGWIGSLALTLALQIVIMLVIGLVAARRVGFSGLQSLWLVALFCLPVAWAAFSLWRFRSTAERRVGYFAGVTSLYWLWAALEVVLG